MRKSATGFSVSVPRVSAQMVSAGAAEAFPRGTGYEPAGVVGQRLQGTDWMPGRYPVYVCLRLVRQRRPCYRAVVNSRNAGDLAHHLLAGLPRESVLVLCLDGSHRVNAVHQVSLGSVDRCPAGARAVFQAAILANASAVILAHNHPSGDPQPSKRDVHLTSALCEAGWLLGIPVLDHIVVGDGSWVRLRETVASYRCRWGN